MKPFLRFVKIEHTLFSLPIVFSGSFLALSQTGARLSWAAAGWILLAVLGARTAGFGLNRIVDRSIDARNPRTKEREIPAGKISLPAAWAFIAASSALFLFAAAQLSRICLLLAPIPLVLFAIYPFLKRFTLWAHLGLGIAWGIAPLGGWLAVAPDLRPFSGLIPALLLAAFCVCWVAGFDIVYALLDENFDREAGLHSMPARLGKTDALRVSEVLHGFGFLALGTLVQVYLNGPLSFAFLAAAGALLAVSHWKVLVNPATPSVIDFAFFKVNAALGFIVFFMTVVK
jgi:4-hydroxybenzoate polyprenyltransferase